MTTNTQAQQVGEIARLCVELTHSTEHDFFVNYSGHVDKVSLYAHVGGYGSSQSVYMRGVNSSMIYSENHPSVINRLQQFLDGTLEINKENIEAPL